PFGPMMAVTLPRASPSETCETAMRPPNCIVRSSVARRGLSELTGPGSAGVRLRDISMGGTAYDRMRPPGRALCAGTRPDYARHVLAFNRPAEDGDEARQRPARVDAQARRGRGRFCSRTWLPSRGNA